MQLKLDTYLKLLLQWQRTINLISPDTVDNAWQRHFEDSMQLADFISKDDKSLCDIGSGAGFPGLVLAIMRPDIDCHFIESDARKCAFLRTVSRETSCENVTIHNGRIEDVLPDLTPEIITARALGNLERLLEYTQGIWLRNKKLKLLLPKGKNYQHEIDNSKKKYDFDVTVKPSKTDVNAAILIVGNISRI